MRLLILPLSAAVFILTSIFSQAADNGNEQPEPSGTLPITRAFASAPALTLEEAWRMAENANAALRQAQAQRAAAEGDAADARGLLWNNPKFSGQRIRREVPQPGMASDNRHEWTAGIEQAFEIAGQQGYRRKGTQLQLQAIDASIENTRREVRAEVERRFVQVLSLQERIITERQSLNIIEDTAASVMKRVAAGEDSRLDGNLARVEAVRARNQIGVLEEQLIQARADLAATVQLPTNDLPSAVGALTIPAPAYTLELLLARAADRPLLRALDLREQAATSRLALERAARYPDITVGISTGREGSTIAREELTGLTVSMPLPLFRHNSGEIGRATTELAQTQIERQATERNTTGSIAALWQKLQSLSARVDALQQTVLPALEENQRLSVKSLEAGEIGLFQLLVVNRQVLDGRRDLIDAQTELRLTRIATHQAAGWAAATP
jgi:cobalt-zinc-cadmium efflux system outer membrane protein